MIVFNTSSVVCPSLDVQAVEVAGPCHIPGGAAVLHVIGRVHLRHTLGVRLEMASVTRLFRCAPRRILDLHLTMRHPAPPPWTWSQTSHRRGDFWTVRIWEGGAGADAGAGADEGADADAGAGADEWADAGEGDGTGAGAYVGAGADAGSSAGAGPEEEGNLTLCQAIVRSGGRWTRSIKWDCRNSNNKDPEKSTLLLNWRWYTKKKWI